MSTYAATNEASDILGRRVLANLIDAAVLCVGWIVTSVVAMAVSPLVAAIFFSWPVVGAVVLVGLVSVAAGLPYAVLAVLTLLWNGRSPGHRALGLRVVTEDGSPLTFGRILVREYIVKGLLTSLRWALSLGVYFVIDAVRALRHPEEPLWHDIVCRTRVVVE